MAMKNLLTFISPTKDFNTECKVLVKLQIDNSLDLGWKEEDILLATNFPYQYKGVKAQVIDDVFYAPKPPTTKLYAIINLFDKGLIGNDLYWYHDFDAYQFAPITEDGLECFDLGVTNYGRVPRLCSASMFFRKTARDIFNAIKDKVEGYKSNEEVAIMRVRNRFGDRIKRLNISYCFHRFNLRSCYQIADKPIKAAHFHIDKGKLDFYMYGKNKLNIVLMPERLIEIFNRYLLYK